jgi:hypothetical protein
MSPDTMKRYLPQLDDKIARGEETKRSFEHARNTSDSRATSRYDNQREFFAADANIQEDLLIRMRTFREILTAGPKTRIEPGAEFTAELWEEDYDLVGAIYSPVAVDLPDLTVVTPTSPIGDVIRGMVAGNTFVYKIKDKLLAGVIKEIK